MSVPETKHISARERALVEAAREFIAKVDSGRARSIHSYRAFKLALDIEEQEQNHDIDILQ